MDANLTFLILAMLVYANYRVNRSILYPPFIFCSMWLLDILLYKLNLIETNRVHSSTLLFVIAGIMSFSIGALVANFIPKKIIKTKLVILTSSSLARPKESQNGARVFITFSLVCLLPFIFWEAREIAALGSGNGFFIQIHNALIESVNSDEQISAPVFYFFTPIAILSSVYLGLEKYDRYFWITTLLAFIGCILNSGRTSLLLLISSLTASHLFKSNALSFSAAYKVIRWPILIFSLLFIGIVFTNKDTDVAGTNILDVIVYFLVSYIVGPLAAFDYVFQHPEEYIHAPHHTFGILLRITSLLHLTSYVPPPKFDEFVLVPYPANVYTIYKFYFTDFGLPGTLAVMALLGFAQTALYLKARTGSKLGIFIFALSVYPAIMAIFDDAYYSVGIYIRAFMFGTLFLCLKAVPFRIFPKSIVRPQRELQVKSS